MKIPQECDGTINILDDSSEKEMNDPRVQATFKRSRHNNLSIFIGSQDYYELLKKTIRARGNIYHIFKPNNFLDVRNIYQDKASINLTLDEFKNLTSTYRNEKYQPLTIDMTKDKYAGRYRLGLVSLFVPNSNPFQIEKKSVYSNVFEQYLINLRKLAEQQKNQRALKKKNFRINSS